MTTNDIDETQEGNKILTEQLNFYKKYDLTVHIKKKSGLIYNGKVLEIAGDMLILDDRKLGAMPIHFEEIDSLEKYREESQ